MPLAGVVTLIGVGATVVVLAAYLMTITAILVHVNFTLGTIIAGVRAIANQTQPLASVVGEINRDLAGVQQALEGVLKRPRPRTVVVPEAEEMPPAPARAAPRRAVARSR